MPSTIGYPKQRIGRTQKNLDLRNRAHQLTKSAQEYRQARRERAWSLSEKMWRGKHWGGDDGEELESLRDRVTVNVSFSTVNTIFPYVTGSDPSFVIEPYGGEATPQNARLLQAWLNREWRTNRMAGNQHLRRAAWDSLVYGDGYLKVSYTIDEVLKRDSLDKTEIARLWVDRTDPRDVWLDPAADGLHNSRYAVVRIYRSVDELQADKRYRNTSGLEASDDRELDPNDKRVDIPPVATGDDADKIVAVYEFYDLVNRVLVTWTEQVDLPLQVVEDIDCPLVQMSNHILPSCPYHMGELEQLVSLQEELNKTRTQMVEHRRRNAQKWVARKNTLDLAAKQALQSEEVNSVVEIEGDRELNDLLAPLEVPNLAADAYAIDQLIKGDVYEISGVNEYLRGAAADIRRTATEATIIEGATNVKTAQKLRAVEAAARQVGQLLLDMASAVYPLTDADEMTMILTGRDAQAVVAAEKPNTDMTRLMGAKLTLNPNVFDGTYEVFVEQGSTELRNPQAREQKYLTLFLTLLEAAPALVQMGVTVNMRKPLELYLEAAGVDDIEAIVGTAAQAGMPPLPNQPGEPAQGPGYTGGLAGMMAAGQPPPQAGPPTAAPTPENSGMLPPVS